MKFVERIRNFEAYAEGRHHLLALSMIISGISAVLSAIPFYYVWKIVFDSIEGDTGGLVTYGLYALLFGAASIVMYILALNVSHFAGFRIAKNMKKVMLHHVLTLSPGAFDEEGSGRIRRTINDCVESTHAFVAHNLPDLVVLWVLPLVILVMVGLFDWRLGIASMIPIILAYWVMRSMTGKKALESTMMEWMNSQAETNNKAVEYVRGIEVVKVFQQTIDSFQDFKASIDRSAERHHEYSLFARGCMSKFFTLVNGSIAFIIAAVVLIIETSDSAVTPELIADTVFYVTFTPLASFLLMRLLYTSHNTFVADDTLRRVAELLSTKVLDEPEHPMKPNGFSIDFDNVTFRYGEGLEPAVENLTLHVDAGSVTALVGASGSGKSTIAGLAARFWDPQEGTVRIGGVDLREMGSSAVHEMECFVFQHNKLIKGTLRDNVSLGCPGATDEQIVTALEQSQCKDILAKLDNGLDTLIGPGGVYLSGGETQRVAIARALLRNSPIVILDEATAFADPENEHLIQAAIQELARNRTVLLIAHRLTSIVNADQICLLDKGRIIESGRHKDLCDRGGKYRSLWDDYQTSLSWKVNEVAE